MSSIRWYGFKNLSGDSDAFSNYLRRAQVSLGDSSFGKTEANEYFVVSVDGSFLYTGPHQNLRNVPLSMSPSPYSITFTKKGVTPKVHKDLKSREEAEARLKEAGVNTMLIRKSFSEEGSYVVSLYSQGGFVHTKISKVGDHYHISDSISEKGTDFDFADQAFLYLIQNQPTYRLI